MEHGLAVPRITEEDLFQAMQVFCSYIACVEGKVRDTGCTFFCVGEGDNAAGEYLYGIAIFFRTYFAGDEKGLITLQQLGRCFVEIGKYNNLDNAFKVLKGEKTHPVTLTGGDFSCFMGNPPNADFSVFGLIENAEGICGGIL